MRRLFWSIAVLLLAASFRSKAVAADDTAAILERQTQELMDAVTYGKADVWDSYMDASAIYTDENGNAIPKTQMVKDTKQGWALFGAVVLLRMASVYWRWRLPRPSAPRPKDPEPGA